MNKARTLLLAIVFAAPTATEAIELSLEENRAERGNIGFIDTPKLFRQFPETLRAKENFEEIVRQTEDQINLRKVEVLKLRSELSLLRAEREVSAKTFQVPKEERPKAADKKAPPPAPKPEAAPSKAEAAKAAAQSDLDALK